MTQHKLTLHQLNNISDEEGIAWFKQACASTRWATAMENCRPFAYLEQIKESANGLWAQLTEEDALEAFAAHPMIGDVDSLREKFSDTKAMASDEQSGAASASEDTLQQLHELNHAYLEKHGFIFIIFATGKSAEEMLQALQDRIQNDTQTEIQNAAAQQLKITLLRIEKNLELNQ